MGDVVSGRVLLTGASGGIGHAIARALAQQGAQLTLTARRVEVLEPLAAELGARWLACDLADRGSVAQLVESVGDVDLFVSNAALPATGHLTELSVGQIDTILEINLRAPIVIARSLAAGMAARRRGHLAFISSLSGKAASPMASIYNATKFGLRGFALAVREDLREDGVGASVILPGFVSGAGMFADADMELPRGVGTSTPEQVARALIEAVRHDRAEVTVAPLLVRLGAGFASVAPGAAARLQRLAGAGKVASQLAAKQAGKLPPR